jgi:hypothetical protein
MVVIVSSKNTSGEHSSSCKALSLCVREHKML